MILPIEYNKYTRKTKIVSIKVSKNKEFLIWTFKDDDGKELIGFTPSKVYYGNKTYQWYSAIAGFYLPHSYNINLDNMVGKECYICTDTKYIVRNIVPCQDQPKVDKPKVTEAEEPEAIEEPRPDDFEPDESMFK